MLEALGGLLEGLLASSGAPWELPAAPQLLPIWWQSFLAMFLAMSFGTVVALFVLSNFEIVFLFSWAVFGAMLSSQADPLSLKHMDFS